jgi:hypothetical protein
VAGALVADLAVPVGHARCREQEEARQHEDTWELERVMRCGEASPKVEFKRQNASEYN